MTDYIIDVDISKRDSLQTKTNSEILRTSSFQERIDQIRSETPGGHEIENILRKQPKSSPRRGRKTFSPEKSYSPTYDRSTSNSPRRRERSFLRSTSPDKLPFRRSAIWSQWEVTKDKNKECLQEYNIKQMTSLYGKELGGKVDAASEWYRNNGLDRSKTQMEALGWLSEVGYTLAWSLVLLCVFCSTSVEAIDP